MVAAKTNLWHAGGLRKLEVEGVSNNEFARPPSLAGEEDYSRLCQVVLVESTY